MFTKIIDNVFCILPVMFFKNPSFVVINCDKNELYVDKTYSAVLWHQVSCVFHKFRTTHSCVHTHIHTFTRILQLKINIYVS